MFSEIVMDPHWRAGIGFCLGAIIGSFLNVCISRIPAGQSIISPRSSCPKCGIQISWFRNIPILTWLLSRGRANCCVFKIPCRYLYVELSTAIIFSYLFYGCLSLDHAPLLICSMLFTSMILAVIAIDFETMMIPDRFSMGGAVIGVCLSFFFPIIHDFSSEPMVAERISALFASMTGLLISSSLLYWIGAIAERLMQKEALGQGDVKLLGFVGAFCGWKGGLFVIFGGALLGTALMIPVLLFSNFIRKKVPKKNSSFGWGVEIPFGPFLGAASLLYFLVLKGFVDEWFDGTTANFIHFFSIV